MSAPAEIVLYTTTFAATVKIRSDITKIKHILTSKKITYEEVDLTELPHRRRDMLAHSDNNSVLPQLHVNNRFIGTVDELQEFEDWGELDAILRGVSPGKLVAEAAAAFEAASAAAAAADAPVSPVPRFTLEEEEEEAGEPSVEGSEEEIEIAVVGTAVAVEEADLAVEEEEPDAEEASERAEQGLEDEPEAAEEAGAPVDGDDGDSGSEGAAEAAAPEEEPLDEPEQRSLTGSIADTVEVEGEDEASTAPAALTPKLEAAEQSPAQLIQSPISPLSDVETEVPLGDDPHVPKSAPELQEAAAAEAEADAPEDLESSELPTPLKAHRLGEDLNAHPVEGELFPSPEKRPQSGNSVRDDGHLIA